MAMRFAKFVFSVLTPTFAEPGELLDSSSEETSLLQARQLKFNSSRKDITLTLPKEASGNDAAHCLVTGDPHIKPFDIDGEKESCLGPMGDYVLVDVQGLWIHARYLGWKRDGGYSFMRGLVVGGSRLGGEKFTLPIFNDGDVLYAGKEIPPEGVSVIDNAGSGFRILKKPGPKLVGFETTQIADTTWQNSYWIELKTENVVDVLIVINQGGNQHIMISGTKAAMDGNKGQCGTYDGDPSDDKIDVDNCPWRAPTCEFPPRLCPNPEDGKPREPPECINGTDQYNFYADLCTAKWGVDVLKEKEWKLWNCVTDCCGDRDSCPDMGDSGLDGTCLLKGDPHIKVFDSPTVKKHMYAPLDDYWVVKSNYIGIQARYGSKRWDDKAQIMGVAVAGALTGGVKVLIPEGHAPAQIDGTDMVGNQISTAAFDLVYEAEGLNLKFKLDAKKARDPRPLFTLTFKSPDGRAIGTVQVNRNIDSLMHKAQLLLIRLENWILDGVSGQCGNYDGDQDDDNDAKDDRVDAVMASERLFPVPNPQFGATRNTLECTKKQGKKAKKCCTKKHSPTTFDVIQSCIVDHCCGTEKDCDPSKRCDEF